jgi:hypothetical protein
LGIISNVLGKIFGELITVGYTTRGVYSYPYPSSRWIKMKTIFHEDEIHHVGITGFKGITIDLGNGR